MRPFFGFQPLCHKNILLRSSCCASNEMVCKMITKSTNLIWTILSVAFYWRVFYRQNRFLHLLLVYQTIKKKRKVARFFSHCIHFSSLCLMMEVFQRVFDVCWVIENPRDRPIFLEYHEERKRETSNQPFNQRFLIVSKDLPYSKVVHANPRKSEPINNNTKITSRNYFWTRKSWFSKDHFLCTVCLSTNSVFWGSFVQMNFRFSYQFCASLTCFAFFRSCSSRSESSLLSAELWLRSHVVGTVRPTLVIFPSVSLCSVASSSPLGRLLCF